MIDLSLPKSDINIITSAPVFNKNGLQFKPGQFTNLKNPGMPNPYQKSNPLKPEVSSTKPNNPIEKPGTVPSEITKNNKNIFILVGAIAVFGAVFLIIRNN